MEDRVGIITTPVSLTHSRKERTEPDLGDLNISKSFALDCRRWDPAQTQQTCRDCHSLAPQPGKNTHAAPT